MSRKYWLLAVAFGFHAACFGQCGTGFSVPSFHFDSISRDGSLYFADQWLSIDAGEGLRVPVVANFDNTRETISPYLGKGWRLALFESHAVELSESRVAVIMPDGYRFVFVKGADGAYTGNHGWKGLVSGDRFRIGAKCGGAEIEFQKGLIKGLHLGDLKLVFDRTADGRVAAVKKVGQNRDAITVQYTAGGEFQGLVTGDGEKLSIEKELVEPDINEEKTASALAAPVLSLSRVSFEKMGTYRTYTRSEKGGRSSLEIETPAGTHRHFEWDKSTKRVVSDGFWTYRTVLSGDAYDIERTSERGTERWLNNPTHGFEEELSVDGTLTRTFFAKSGPLRNLLRKRDVKIGDTWRTVLSRFYDGEGRLIKERDEQNHVEKTVDYHGENVVETIRDAAGSVVQECVMNKQAQPVSVSFPTRGLKMHYVYDHEGKLSKKTIEKSP